MTVAQHVEKGFVGFDDTAPRIPDKDADDVRVDQAADPGLPFQEIVIETGVLQGDRRLRRQQFQYRDPVRREHVRCQIVIKIEHPDQVGLFYHWQAKDRSDMVPADILICREGFVTKASAMITVSRVRITVWSRDSGSSLDEATSRVT